MKKVIITMILTVFTVNINASQNQANEPSADTIVVRTDPITPDPSHGEPHRGQEISIYIYQDGGLLDFGTAYSGCSVALINENELVEYSGVVGSDGTVVLPGYLEGVFELQLTVDNLVYVGEIQLE